MELIIVIAIIAIIAAAIFVALDPARRLHEARNARRWSDVATMLDAVRKYQVDNDGTHYSSVAGLTQSENFVVGTNGVTGCDAGCTGVTTQPQCVDISSIGTNYLAEVPLDPATGAATFSDYYLSVDANGAVTVGSCDPEGEGAGGGGSAPTIRVIR